MQRNRRPGWLTASLWVFVFVSWLALTPPTRAQTDPRVASDPDRVMVGVRFDGNTSIVSFVVKGSPADRAGIQIGDEILSAGEKFVVQPFDLMSALDAYNEGDVVRLEVMRGPEVRFFELKLIRAVKGDVVIERDGKVVEAPRMGLLNELAPELTVQQWSGLPQGISARLKNNRGKVICMLLFQTDCEFSLQRGLPELKAMQDEFHSDPDILLLAIQTPFRNFDDNTHGAAIQLFESRGLTVPLGHDGSARQRTITYDAYRAYGTPWYVVLDKQGIVHYNDSSLPIEEAREMFATLKSRPLPTVEPESGGTKSEAAGSDPEESDAVSVSLPAGDAKDKG